METNETNEEVSTEEEKDDGQSVPPEETDEEGDDKSRSGIRLYTKSGQTIKIPNRYIHLQVKTTRIKKNITNEMILS